MAGDEKRIFLDTITIQPATLGEKIEVAARVGYRGLEFRGFEIDPLDEDDSQSLADQAQRRGLVLLGVCPEPEVYHWHYQWDTPLESLLRRRFARYQALSLNYAIFPVMSADGTLLDTTRHYERICRLASEYGLDAGLEFIGHVPKVATLEVADQIVRQVDAPNGGIVLDLFHFFRGGSPMESLDDVDPRRLLTVHVDDAMPLPREELIGSQHRVYPGSGQMNPATHLRALEARGYDGPYVVELFNESYWSAAPYTVARQAFETTWQTLRSATSPVESR
jgi:sugar phosphate isomerase/epimerase